MINIFKAAAGILLAMFYQMPLASMETVDVHSTFGQKALPIDPPDMRMPFVAQNFKQRTFGSGGCQSAITDIAINGRYLRLGLLKPARCQIKTLALVAGSGIHEMHALGGDFESVPNAKPFEYKWRNETDQGFVYFKFNGDVKIGEPFGIIEPLCPVGSSCLSDSKVIGHYEKILPAYLADLTKKKEGAVKLFKYGKTQNGCEFELPDLIASEVAKTYDVPLTPEWVGHCFDGKTQGPGLLVYQATGKPNGIVDGFMLNGRFTYVPDRGNRELNYTAQFAEDAGPNKRARSTLYYSNQGKQGLLAAYMNPEVVSFVDKYHRLNYKEDKNSCKVAFSGLLFHPEYYIKRALVEPWLYKHHETFSLLGNWHQYYRPDEPNGSPMQVHHSPLDPIIWHGRCNNGFAEGSGVLELRGKYRDDHETLSIENMIAGVPNGKITYLPFKRDAYYYKSIWFKKYDDYARFADYAEKQLGGTGLGTDQMAAEMIRAGFDKPQTDSRSRLAAEEALRSIFALKFALTTDKSKGKRWSDSLLGLSLDGAASSNQFFLDYEINPSDVGRLPSQVRKLTLRLEVNLRATYDVGMGNLTFAGADSKDHKSIVTIVIDRNKSFKVSGQEKLFDLTAYLSGLGSTRTLSDLKPDIKLLTVLGE